MKYEHMTAEDIVKNYRMKLMYLRILRYLVLAGVITILILFLFDDAKIPTIALVEIGAFLLLYLFRIISYMWVFHWNYIIQEEGDPLKFAQVWTLLAEYDKRKKAQISIAVNVSYGYYYAGNYEEALHILESMQLTKCNAYFVLLYYNLRANCYFELKQYEKLDIIKHELLGCPYIRKKRDMLARKEVVNIIRILQLEQSNEFDEYRNELELREEKALKRLQKVHTSYRLAALEYKMGNLEAAQVRCNYVIEHGKKLYVVEKAKILLSNIHQKSQETPVTGDLLDRT